MAQAVIQTSFASGEWAPKLRSRVDVQKYRTGAAYLRNFYVDYAGGGASTRQGTKFINQCKTASARLIPFQPSSTLSYVLEFGQNYIRFYSNGAPILEAATTISGATNASPGVITDTAHGYASGDWIYITVVGGMTQLNGNYYIVAGVTTNSYTLTDLNGNAINTTTYGAYTSGGQAQRVYTITTPYSVGDLFPNQATQNPGLKWVQDVTSLIICHPSYAPAILTIISATNWTLSTIVFGASVLAPTNVAVSSNLPTSSDWAYSYLVTSVDINGQESGPSTPASTNDNLDYIGSNSGTNTITWTAAAGAVSYNVYKASPVYDTTFASGTQYGFVGNVTGTTFTDSYPGIGADFSQTPPIPTNPFLGASVLSLALTANANYTSVPSVVIAAPSSGLQATAYASLVVNTASLSSFDIINSNGTSSPSAVGVIMSFVNGVHIKITSATHGSFGSWTVTGISVINAGSATSGSVPSTVTTFTDVTYGLFSYGSGHIGLTWDIGALVLIQGGFGYTSDPAVTISGAATATSTISSASGGNPGVPGFLQERLWLGAQTQSLQTVNISQPGSFFNYNVSNPSEDDDAISATIISEELNDIRSLLPVPTGMIAFTGKGAWLLNGGGGISTMNPITPSNITAQPQAFNGANDLRPIKINFDALYVTNKGNYVRDLTYNLYAQIFTGADITTFSNHLFFGFALLDWCWAEEPFKTLWAVRNDGALLSLGYVKDQELIGWAHHDTNGQFQSCCSAYELVNNVCVVDAVYLIVQRLVNGNLVSYVERMADRYFPYDYEDSWSVDCALQTVPQVSPTGTLTISGNASVVGNSVTLTDTADAPFTSTMAANSWIVRAGGGIYEITGYTSTSVVTAEVIRVPPLLNSYTNVPFPVTEGYTIWEPTSTVTGLTQLIGQTVTGVADGLVVPPTSVSATGTITLTGSVANTTKITLGLAFLPQLQTLPLDLGEPTVQGKRKKIPAVAVRVADTLGMSIGTSFPNVTTMKDFVLGSLGTQSNALVTGLVSGDGRAIIDQEWQEAGNYCLQQNLPYPATILGVIPEVTVGDTPVAR